MAYITVFTPSYNRKDLLGRAYEALKRQTSKDFEWLIVDDGSTDRTGDTVREWMDSEKSFRIRYVYKENGGLHTAYNTAIENLRTPLAVCVDSDDYLPDDAVERILSFWKEHGSDKYAGIIGLDYDYGGHLIGNRLPDLPSMNLIRAAAGKYGKLRGDRKLVVRSELYKAAAPMKVFPGEKFFNPNYLHMEIARKYDFLVMNENLCFVDYQPEGMSSNIWKQYFNSPRSFAELRKQHLSFPGAPLKYRFKEYVHYQSSCFLAGRSCGLENVNVLLYLTSLLPGLGLSLYIRYRNSK